MRRIKRLDLSPQTQKALNRRQVGANAKDAAGTLNVEKVWKAARKTKPLKAALAVLQEMAGPRHRCMYCGDSHGTDIEHFWPKSPYYDRMFCWLNFLLCCAECGRFKGTLFPVENGTPLLVDPTAEDPWQFLDFDPATGNIVARFDPATNDWTRKGSQTVAVLHLNCREALASSYQKTHRRLAAVVEAAVEHAAPSPGTLSDALREADDHGLLGWYFRGTGQHVRPFSDLRRRHPAVWNACGQILN